MTQLFYQMSEKLYSAGNPQGGAQGGYGAGPDMGNMGGQGAGPDGNVYDADYKVVDDDENK